MKKIGIKKIIRYIWFSLAVLFMIWTWTTFQSRNLPEGTFTSNDQIAVFEDSDMITFKSVLSNNSVEIIFFQGGLTDPMAYAPLCRKIAENGFTCHLIKMAYRLPQKDYNKIARLFDLKSVHFVIGGHSQGGKMAAQFVFENPMLMKGLFLLGTSHPRDIDMSHLSVPTIKLYAEKDGLASVHEVVENKNMLPRNAKLVLLKGANHSHFGYLGKLLMDNSAEISLEEQQMITIRYLSEFLNDLVLAGNFRGKSDSIL